MRSYTGDELERATGFERRTIAYYVQEGLLPKVGRRGPRTRYPKRVMDRLLFIRRVREAEEAGELGAISLSDMRAIFERVSPELIAQVADKQLPVAAAIGGAPEPGGRSARTRSEAVEGTWLALEADEPPKPHTSEVAEEAPQSSLAAEEMSERSSMRSMRAGAKEELRDLEALEMVDMPANEMESGLGDALSELQTRARKRRRREPGSLDTWSRVDISPDIALSVRGVTGEDAPLLESVGQKLRRLISDRRNRRQR